MTVTDRRPFRLAHRGHVECQGVLFGSCSDTDWNRIAPYYRHGCQIYRVGACELALLYSTPMSAEVARLDGAALVRYGNSFGALPLAPQDLDKVDLPGLEIVDAIGGWLRRRRFSDKDRIEPCDWFALDDWPFEVAGPLTSTDEPTTSIGILASNRREALEHSIGEPPPEAAMFDAVGDASRGEWGRSSIRVAPGVFARAVRLGLRLLARALWTVVSNRKQQHIGHSIAIHARLSDSKLSLRSRLASWLRRQIWRSHLGRVFGAAQSRYLGQMLALFERGNLEEALRHAIPTSKVGGSGGAPRLLPSGPRANLDMSGVRLSGGSIGLSPDLFAHLRATYEAAFATLVNRGQIPEAAFVLSELLEDDARAVSFLESHGRLIEAAKLAELRQLAPGLIVRQWFMAGDRARAIAIARRDGAFEDAILRLKGIPAAQESLRLCWADHLATAGNFTGAALVVRDLPDGSRVAKVWLERAIEIGGVAGAQALGLKTRLCPDEFEQSRNWAVELMVDDSPDAPAARVALARELAQGNTADCRAISRGVVRALVRDMGNSPTLLTRSELVDLARFSQDGALQADLPLASNCAYPNVLDTQTIPRQIAVREGDKGTATVLDVRAIARGRLLVARGEAGCSLLDARGKVIHHFDVPSERLVLSSNGDRVLALAHRDDTTLVSRINLLSRTAETWCDLRASAFAANFDGADWYVAIKDRVCAIDATLDQLTSTWRSGATEESIVQIAWTPKRLAFATGSGECWTHQLGPNRLVKRERVEGLPVLGPNGARAAIRAIPGDGIELVALVDLAGGRQVPIATADATRVNLVDFNEQWVLVAIELLNDVPPAIDIKLINLERLLVSVSFHLQAARSACARLHTHLLTVGDDCGRVLTVDLETLCERTNARI